MSFTKLDLYNNALQIVGEVALASLTENRPSRYHLDQIYNTGEVRGCLEDGDWVFARRAQRLDYDTTITPDFGYRRAFAKSSDWCATSAVCSDEYFNIPITQYADENGYLFCDIDTIYVKFVSDDAAFGGDWSKWTNAFQDYVCSSFAARLAIALTADKERMAMIDKLKQKRLVDAQNQNLRSDPTKFPALGSWAISRRGRTFRDRGNRTNLIG